jgi:hypothetical protein
MLKHWRQVIKEIITCDNGSIEKKLNQIGCNTKNGKNSKIPEKYK